MKNKRLFEYKVNTLLIFMLLFCINISCSKNMGTLITDTDGCQGYIKPSESNFVLPYPVGTTYKVTQGNCGGFSHRGPGKFAYDFNMEEGDLITVTRTGTVKKIEESTIEIEHSDLTVSFYSHVQEGSAVVNVGDIVNQGDTLAKASSTYFDYSVGEPNGMRYDSIPITFKNASSNRFGLLVGESYTALDYVQNTN